MTTPIQAPDGTVREIPDDQKDAALKAGGKPVVKMSDPKGAIRWIPESLKDEALKAGGKVVDAPVTATPATSAATAPSASNAYSSPNLDSNLKGEGTYSLTKDGKTLSVPYSNVENARSQGYDFADQDTLNRYAKDYGADPAHKGSVADFISKNKWSLAPTGLPELEGVGASLERGVAGLDTAIRKHTGGTPTKAEEELQMAAAAPTAGGIPAKVGELGEQVGEILIPEAVLGKLAEGAKIGKGISEASKVKELGEVLNKYPALKMLVRGATEGTKAAAEQGGQQYVRSGGDTESAKRAAEFGAAGGAGAEVIAPTVAGATGNFFRRVLRNRFDIDEAKGAELIDKMRKENDAIRDEANRIHSENVGKIKAARDAGNDAEAARLEVTNAHNKAQSVAARRQNLTDTIQKTRADVQQRLQNMRDAARSYFNTSYRDIEKKAGNKGVDYGTLAEGVYDALQHVKGSEESTRAFKDILAKAKGEAEAQEAEGMSVEELASLAPDERERLVDEMREKGELTHAPLADLNGYYSELGRVVNSGSVPGDVQQAARSLRNFIDAQIKEELGPELYEKNKMIRSQYKRYAEGFKDYSGPAGSGSPVAMSLQAKDPYHAAEPLVGKPQEVNDRIRNIVVGKRAEAENQFLGDGVAEKYISNPDGTVTAEGNKTPAWRYRKKTHAMIEHLRKMEDGLSSLPKQESLEGDVAKAQAKHEEALSKAKAKELPSKELRGQPTLKVKGASQQPRLESAPEIPKISPEDLQKRKAEVLRKTAHNISKFGTWMAVLGPITGITTFLKTGDPDKSLEYGGEAFVAGLIGPYYVSKMLQSPQVVETLTKVSRGDLEKLAALPPDERTGVEDMLRQLSNEAVKSGKLKAGQIPWLRILGGESGRKAAKIASPEQSGQPTLTDQDLNSISHQLKQMEAQ